MVVVSLFSSVPPGKFWDITLKDVMNTSATHSTHHSKSPRHSAQLAKSSEQRYKTGL